MFIDRMRLNAELYITIPENATPGDRIRVVCVSAGNDSDGGFAKIGVEADRKYEVNRGVIQRAKDQQRAARS